MRAPIPARQANVAFHHKAHKDHKGDTKTARRRRPFVNLRALRGLCGENRLVRLPSTWEMAIEAAGEMHAIGI
jgi:hypothetical protein